MGDKDNKITVHVKIAGPIDGKPFTFSGTVELSPGDSIKKLLKKADTLAETRVHKPFKKAFRQGVEPVLLLNGEGIDLSRGKNRALKDGDQVSVVVAIGGG
jgi:molybdopterin converting factor small subunit